MMMAPPIPINTPIVQTCAQPNRDVSVITAASPPPTEYAGEITAPTAVYVQVIVDADGSVQGARIYKSDGNAKLEQAAIEAARSSTFSPKIIDCNPARSSYLFRANFSPPAASASVMPSSAAACPQPNQEAQVAAVPSPAPSHDQSVLKAHVEAVIEVVVGADGVLQKEMIYKSSGFAGIDRAAYDAARRAHFTPKLVNCVPTQTDYKMRFGFDPPQP